ncbi:MAG: family 43 glycosylhydrolase [Faecousia sp.]
MYDRFYPGKPWLDTNGNRIQAHGGSVISVDGVFYWYGENKEFTDGQNGIWTWGVRCYRSTDLYNWEDCGLIIQPDLTNEDSPLNPYHAMLDRPHIIYNRFTGKYVCWMKVMRSNGTQTETVMTADNILGPYTPVRQDLRPLGMDAGDFDLAVAPDGKAYYYFERVHSETICADLTADYTDVTGFYSTHFPRTNPPFVREATAHFVRGHKHYLITSGTTGYLPNPSEAAVADTWHGPYTVLGNPHPEDQSQTSYHCQISSVFKVPGKKDLYIACADRWVPDKMHLRYDFYGRAFDLLFNNRTDEIRSLAQSMGLTREELADTFGDTHRNTSIADYVWLPLRFEGEKVIIDWKDEWKLSDYE